METWGEWTFSANNRDEIVSFCAQYVNSETGSVGSDWYKLFENRNRDDSSVDIDVVETYDLQYEDELASSFLESLNSHLNVATFMSLPEGTLKRVLTVVNNKITENGFIKLCKVIILLDPASSFVESCFLHIIQPVLQAAKECSICRIHQLQELARAMPDKVSNCLIIPLVKENGSNNDLICSLFQVVPNGDKDKILLAIMKKKEKSESDWVLAHLLARDTESSTIGCWHEVAREMNRNAKLMCKSQSFTKLLVLLAKNSKTEEMKQLLHPVALCNETLLKRHALKYLETEVY